MGMRIPTNRWRTLGEVIVAKCRYEVNQHEESGQLGLIAYDQNYDGLNYQGEEEGVDVEEMSLEVLGQVAAKIFSIHCE